MKQFRYTPFHVIRRLDKYEPQSTSFSVVLIVSRSVTDRPSWDRTSAMASGISHIKT
jgi:hypothetical protein